MCGRAGPGSPCLMLGKQWATQQRPQPNPYDDGGFFKTVGLHHLSKTHTHTHLPSATSDMCMWPSSFVHHYQPLTSQELCKLSGWTQEDCTAARQTETTCE